MERYSILAKFVSKKFQHFIAKGLDLQLCKIKPDSVIVNAIHDFLESVVGAIYVDAKSLKPVKTVVVELCRLFEIQMAENCDLRLPYNLRTCKFSLNYNIENIHKL